MRSHRGRGVQIPRAIRSVDRWGSNSFTQSKLNTRGVKQWQDVSQYQTN